MRFIVLTLLLMMLTLTTSSAEEITTNNLISQDFSTGWSGTATQRHGNSTVAAVNNTYIKSDDVSLKDDANLTEAQLQDGLHQIILLNIGIGIIIIQQLLQQ